MAWEDDITKGPGGPPTKRVQVRLDDRRLEKLDRIAKHYGYSHGAVMRYLIDMAKEET